MQLERDDLLGLMVHVGIGCLLDNRPSAGIYWCYGESPLGSGRVEVSPRSRLGYVTPVEGVGGHAGASSGS